jgi:hypothetical protein
MDNIRHNRAVENQTQLQTLKSYSNSLTWYFI